MNNPLMMNWRKLFAPVWEAEDGTGAGGDTGASTPAGEGGDAATGDTGADGNSGTPAPVLGAQTGKAEGAGAKDGEASKEKAPDGDATEGAEDNAVPADGESYEFTLPEGVDLDAAMAEALAPLLREANVGRADANKLAEALTGYMSAQSKAAVDAYISKVEKWTADAKADKELGGDWDTTVSAANNALLKLGTPELTEALAETGMSNHPEMIRFMYRVAKATGNDVLDRGQDVNTSDVPPEQGWYGKTTPNKKAG